MGYTVEFDFGAGWVSKTAALDGRYPVQRYRAVHRDLKPVVSTCSFALVNDVAAVQAFLAATVDTKVRVHLDSVDYFTGLVRRTHRIRVGLMAPEAIEIECVGNWFRLDKRITFTETWSDYHVSDPNTPAKSLLHQLFVKAGFSLAELDLAEHMVDLDRAVFDSSETRTYREVIEQVLTEIGCSAYDTPSGVIKLYNLGPASIAAGDTLSTGPGGNIAGSYEVQRSETKVEAVDVTWRPHETVAGQVVFEDLTGSTAGLACVVPLPAGSYYPEGAGAAASIRLVYKVEGRELVCVDSPTLDWDHTGDVECQVDTADGLGRLLRFHSDTGGVIIKLKIVGTATLLKDQCKSVREEVSGTDLRESIEAKWIHDEWSADRCALVRANWHKHAVLECSFPSVTLLSASPGDYVALADTDLLGLSYTLRIVSVRDGKDPKSVEVVAEGVAELSATAVVSSRTQVDAGAFSTAEAVAFAAADATAKANAASAAAANAAAWVASSGMAFTSKTAFGKVGGSVAWDQGAYSVAGYGAGATLSFKAAQSDMHLMLGLNTDPATDDDYDTIDYAWYPAGDGNAYISAGGTVGLNKGAYTAATVFKLAYDGRYVRCYMAGTLKQTFDAGTGLVLHADSSFYSLGAAVAEMVFVCDPTIAVAETAAAYRESLLDAAPSSPHVGDWYLRYSATSGTTNRGIFLCATAGTWPATAEATPSTKLIAAAWADICVAANNGTYGTVADYIGSGVNFAEVLAANTAFIDELFAQTITASGKITGAELETSGGTLSEKINLKEGMMKTYAVWGGSHAAHEYASVVEFYSYGDPDFCGAILVVHTGDVNFEDADDNNRPYICGVHRFDKMTIFNDVIFPTDAGVDIGKTWVLSGSTHKDWFRHLYLSGRATIAKGIAVSDYLHDDSISAADIHTKLASVLAGGESMVLTGHIDSGTWHGAVSRAFHSVNGETITIYSGADDGTVKATDMLHDDTTTMYAISIAW